MLTTKMYEEGLAVRRAVLGADYVDKAVGEANDFTGPLQEVVTEYCWGKIWTRPGLSRKTRSLNRPHELKAHVRGALNNGCTKEEIMETLLQATIYCGVPAGVASFRIAKEALEEFE